MSNNKGSIGNKKKRNRKFKSKKKSRKSLTESLKDLQTRINSSRL